MDDAENEVLDWENEDDEQQQLQSGDSRRQSLAEVDADDAVSLGDEDEQPRIMEESNPQPKPIPQIRNNDADSSYRDQERSHSRDTYRAPQKADQNKSDRKTPREPDRRRRSSRSSPPRSQTTLQPPPPRLTHALPPKPILAAAAASPAARGTSTKGSSTRVSGGDPLSRNISSSSLSYDMNTKGSITEWETRLSSRGDTYYYNTITYESTWSKPADYPGYSSGVRESGSDDGRSGRYNVSSSTTFRSSPTISDKASQDAPFSRPEYDTSRNSSRQPHHDAPRNGERHHDLGIDAQQAASFGNGGTHARPGSGSGLGPPPRDHALPRDRDAPSAIPARRGRTANNSHHEQKVFAEEEVSRRRSRISNVDSYTGPDDTIHPTITRRPSSPARGPPAQTSDRPPIVAPRRRPASPSPPTTQQPTRPGYDRKSYEQASSSAPLPKEPRASREARDERPAEARRPPTGPALQAYASRPTNSRYRDEGLGPDTTGSAQQARTVVPDRDPMRTVHRPQELEVYGSSNTVAVGFGGRRSMYPERDEVPPVRQRVPEASYRSVSPPRDADMKFVPNAAYTREMGRARDEQERLTSRRAVSHDKGDAHSHRSGPRRLSRSRTPERYPPDVELARPRAQSRERGYYESSLPPPSLSRNDSYPARDYPPPSQYAGPSERAAEYVRPAVIDESRPRGGPPPRPAEGPDTYNTRQSRTEPAIPTAPREMVAREPPREPRRDASPGKSGRRRGESARKMTSGTNSVPLGRNRYVANSEVAIPNPVAPGPSPVQRYQESPAAEAFDRRDRVQEPEPSRRDVYERSSDVMRYADRSSTVIYETPNRRTTPPPQDYATRVSDPQSKPPHMVDSRRQPVSDYHTEPARAARPPSPTPPQRRDIYPRKEPPRQYNGDAEKPRIPTAPNLSRIRNLTKIPPASSWTSEVDRRPQASMDVDPRYEEYPPPSDRFRDSLRVSPTVGTSRGNGLQPAVRPAYSSLPVPPAALPPNPVVAGRDQRSTHPERSPTVPTAAPNTRWNDRHPPPHIKQTEATLPIAPRPPLSPTTSKKALSGAEVSPPRLRRPSMVVPNRNPVDAPVPSDVERGPERERVQRDRDWDQEREREKERADRDRGRYERPADRLQPPPPMGRSNSLLDRLGAPSANANGPPSLFERVSGTVTPMKRNSELMSSGGGAMMDAEDDLYAPAGETSEMAIKRRRKGGGRARRSGGKRH